MKKYLLNNYIIVAKSKLKEKDYIGRKIAEVMMYGTQEEIEAVKQKYAPDIEEAKELRKQINEWQAELDALSTK